MTAYSLYGNRIMALNASHKYVFNYKQRYIMEFIGYKRYINLML